MPPSWRDGSTGRSPSSPRDTKGNYIEEAGWTCPSICWSRTSEQTSRSFTADFSDIPSAVGNEAGNEFETAIAHPALELFGWSVPTAPDLHRHLANTDRSLLLAQHHGDRGFTHLL